MSSFKEKPLRKVLVALDSSVARSLELDSDIDEMEKNPPPGRLDSVEESGGCEGPGPADSPKEKPLHRVQTGNKRWPSMQFRQDLVSLPGKAEH